MKSESTQQGIQQADFHFTRRQVRDLTGWGDTQVRVHLGRLVEMEYHRTRWAAVKAIDYELAYRGEGRW